MRFLLLDLPQSNVASVRYWLLRNGQQVELLSQTARDHMYFDALLIPGVGSFDVAIRFLHKYGGIKTIRAFSERGSLVIGICLGMQLMCLASDEGTESGLGLVNGHVRLLTGGTMQVPNIGWRGVSLVSTADNSIFSKIDNKKFYFMHSYALPYLPIESIPKTAALLVSESNTKFISGFSVDNLVGLQFHPEKSYGSGDELLSEIVKHYA